MGIIEILLIVVLIFGLINLFFTFKTLEQNRTITELQTNLSRVETTLKDEFRANRGEFNLAFKENREELNFTLKNFLDTLTKNIFELSSSQKNQFELFSNSLNTLLKENNLQLNTVIDRNDKNFIDNRLELKNSLKAFSEEFEKNIKELNNSHEKLKNDNELRLKEILQTIDFRLQSIETKNETKLEEMRKTVDDKLHEHLEKRIADSFKLVSERLELVHKGLGEMQTLASGVGDLKKVLTNVKSRGILGEIQLGAILENILTKEQYVENSAIRPNTQERVEFAIKLPGKDSDDKAIFLAIDSKFPTEGYNALLDSYDIGDGELIKQNQKNLENSIKGFAKTIKEKYIHPPYTTDFAIMFLPFEGLFAEVVRNGSLIEYLYKEQRIIITGPTTLVAILNTLQVGFKTLAIEKRSSEVWQVLGAVKSEFNKFSDVLKKAQDSILKAHDDIDKLVGTRTKMIQSKLKKIEELPEESSKKLIDFDVE
ncbi:MAG: DNA recombination protein RmuC [Campylobacterales bacterium]|nr:DNA recombination protein RmuC [Campylobacterales bacterium]